MNLAKGNNLFEKFKFITNKKNWVKRLVMKKKFFEEPELDVFFVDDVDIFTASPEPIKGDVEDVYDNDREEIDLNNYL